MRKFFVILVICIILVMVTASKINLQTDDTSSGNPAWKDYPLTAVDDKAKKIKVLTPLAILNRTNTPAEFTTYVKGKVDDVEITLIDANKNGVYDEKGKETDTFKLGQTFQVELLVKTDKEIPYGVIDEPLAAGFELLRQDIASTRSVQEFNTTNQNKYRTPWARQENAADRLVFYTYSMKGELRFVYFIKAMYSGRFTWLPTIAQGMYHPQYFGRSQMKTVVVSE